MPMLRLPSSHRARMRLLRWSIAAAALATVAGLVVLVPNTGRSLETPHSNRDAMVVPQPKRVDQSPEALRAARQTLDTFIRSAAIRRNLARSWPLATRRLKVDTTRRQWLAGNLPVPPYPAAQFRRARYAVTYSFQGVLGYDVTVEPKRPTGLWGEYKCELHGGGLRWLVEYCYGAATPHGRESPLVNPSLGGG